MTSPDLPLGPFSTYTEPERRTAAVVPKGHGQSADTSRAAPTHPRRRRRSVAAAPPAHDPGRGRVRAGGGRLGGGGRGGGTLLAPVCRAPRRDVAGDGRPRVLQPAHPAAGVRRPDRDPADRLRSDERRGASGGGDRPPGPAVPSP